jgi:hypothetical protein
VFDPGSDPRDELRENLRRWSDQSYASYEYTYQRTNCECLADATRPYVIRVSGDAVVDVRDALTGDPAPATFMPLTVEDLFGLIDDAIRRDVYALSVEYDRAAGYPTVIRIDYEKQIADDELTIHATSLVPQR